MVDQQQNYEFLYDEEYQNIKMQKDQVSTQKWQILCQKLGLKFSLNQIYATLEILNGFLAKQKQASEKLMFYCEESIRTKSSSFLMGTGILSYQQEIQSCYNLEETCQISQMSKKVEKKVHGLVKNQCELLLKFEKEREKNEFLLKELQRKDTFRSQKSGQNSQYEQQESYIEDLEVQLQESRAALLDKKIKLSDKEEEIKILKKQIEQMNVNFMQLEDEKKEIDNLVIRVSQQLKNKEMGLTDFNYQLQSEKELLNKQVDYQNKQLLEEKEKVKSLEMIESDLLHKLETQSQELINLKNYLGEIEEKLEVKSDAIEKAHKVIQRLNEEMEKGSNSFSKVEQEKEQFRKENKELNKKVFELNKQIQLNINQQYIANAQYNGQLKTEVDELKEALKQYQEEYEQEKTNLLDSVRELNEQKYEIQQEKDKLEAQIKKLQTQFEEEQEVKNQLIAENILKQKRLEQEIKDLEDQYKNQLQTREQSAQSNIMYMQRRLKEVTQSDDSHNKNSQTMKGKDKVSHTAYLLEVKKEFDKITEEFLEIRNLVKQECMDQSAVSHKLRIFEEFRIVFLDQLTVFESKAIELSELSQKYEKQLDEQKKVFLMMKSLVKEKDQLIAQQQKQLLIRDQAIRNNVGILGKEIDRSCELMSEELMKLILERESEVRFMHSEKIEMEKRFLGFKNEFVELLDDRDQSKNDSLKLIGQIEVQKREICQLADDHLKFIQQLRTLLCLKNNSNSNEGNILRTIEEIVDELKIRRDEVIQYKEQIQEVSSQNDDERKILHQRIHQVENQIEQIQKDSLVKEEEVQVQYIQKETKYINEIQRLQTECSGFQNEAQLREKQNKKLQEKLGNSLIQIDCLQKEIDQLFREKDELIEREERMGEDLRGIQEQMEQTQIELNQRKETMEQMESKMKNYEDKQRVMSANMYDKEKELTNERELNIQLQDEKFQAKSEIEKLQENFKILEKENQNLYVELRRYKDHINSLQANMKASEYEREDLKRAYAQMGQVMQQAQQEMAESHQTLDELKKQVEDAKYKDKYIGQLKEEIKSFSIQEQQLVLEIDLLKKLLNPEKVNVEVQTRDSGMQEINFMREEMGKCRKDAWGWGKEAEGLRESLKRSNLEIDRLIQEKRELEDLVDQQNQSIKQIRLNQALKENSSVQNSMPTTLSPNMMGTGQSLNLSTDLYAKILQEKENYILRLEAEMGEMRHEIETLKGKLLSSEINKSQIIYSSLDNNSLKGGLSNQKYHKSNKPQSSFHKEDDILIKYR